ncbi:GNAT family N-acetyltransferase [Paenibacillus sp. HJL G12]|uniref:GNAT family N-acetyltransferase n=1 Tax=Paenibacillus dendrobii TaxID=2691084 RepID=A0A7X3LGM5_9BACL|nr:GNAT family N-acetyltransferase [Paenibacillus dendrobii]MWV43370.1 GNAT family N-acetyltransferase [Paenibacillus dendrobii]
MSKPNSLSYSRERERAKMTQNADIEIREFIPSGEEYIQLVESTGWKGIVEKGSKQLEEALEKSWYIVSALHNDKVIGTGRIISDGVYQGFICDLIVLPEYQNIGVGTHILKKLLLKCKEKDVLMVHLFAAVDKCNYYKKFGFEERPQDAPGMKWVNRDVV